jgi:Ca2+-binding RTX toxin-like protein
MAESIQISTVSGFLTHDGYDLTQCFSGLDFSYGASTIAFDDDGKHRVSGGHAADWLFGGGGNDTIYGDGFAPGISGQGRGPDQHIGGDDRIWGGDGDDWISGGHGADWLWGGGGADRFVVGSHIPINPTYITPYSHVLDTGVGCGARDVIFDFEQGLDLIDLSLLQTLGYRHLNINDAYEYIGTAEFTGERPQVRFEIQGTQTIIQLDGTSYPSRGVDGVVDAEVELAGRFDIQASDLVL